MLKEIRSKIDKIDSKIIELLSKRIKLAIETRKYKKKILDKDREKEVLENIIKYAEKHKMDKDFIKNLYKKIIKQSKK